MPGNVIIPEGWNTSKPAIYEALETWKETGTKKDKLIANKMAHQYRDYMTVCQMLEKPKSITFNPVIHKSEIFKVNGFGGA